jgi:hypothetical protein
LKPNFQKKLSKTVKNQLLIILNGKILEKSGYSKADREAQFDETQFSGAHNNNNKKSGKNQ